MNMLILTALVIKNNKTLILGAAFKFDDLKRHQTSDNDCRIYGRS